MGYIIGQTIDCNGVGTLRGQRHIPANINRSTPPTPASSLVKRIKFNFCAVFRTFGIYFISCYAQQDERERERERVFIIVIRIFIRFLNMHTPHVTVVASGMLQKFIKKGKNKQVNKEIKHTSTHSAMLL